MQSDAGTQVELVIKGVFDGIAGRVGQSLSFAQQAIRVRAGIHNATIDGEAAQIAVSRDPQHKDVSPALLTATIL